MAATAPLAAQADPVQLSGVRSAKALAESPDLKYIPSNYAYSTNPCEVIAVEEGSVPVIDFSLLSSGIPGQRSEVLQDLDRACQEWGFFVVVNHGIPQNLMKAVINACKEFFDMPEEVKRQFEGKHVLDPIRYGTSFNASKDKIFCWRDFLKFFVHPEFHCPNKPEGLRDLSLEYSERVRKVASKLLEGISENLGLEESYLGKEMELDSGLQVFVANYYPPCPQPKLAIGILPHSDHGLLTLLIQNEIGGLQIQHKGKWVNVNALPNSILVNTGDHLEIFSNGKYKSVMHRAAVNSKVTRMSVAITNGPSLEAIVGPAELPLQAAQSCKPAYNPMKYMEYLELQQSNKLEGKSCLDRVRVEANYLAPGFS